MAEPKRYYQRTNPKQYSYRFNKFSNHGKELPPTEQGKSTEDAGNEHHTISVNNTGVNNKKWTTADKIAMGMLVVTALLAIFTYQLYHTAIHDSKTADTSASAATNAAKIADSTFKASKRYDDSSLKIQRIVFNSNNKAETKREIRDSTSIAAQISSLKESENQFEVSHSPYFNVVGYSISPSNTLDIDIENQGTQVAQILEYEVEMKAGQPNKSYVGILKPLDTSKNVRYNLIALLAPGKQIELIRPLDSTIDIQALNSGKKNLYILMAIYYFNTATSRYVKFETVSQYNVPDGRIGMAYLKYIKLKKY